MKAGSFTSDSAHLLRHLPSPFFVPSCLPFSHSSLEKQQRLQDRRKPRPRTARSDSLFFMQFPRFVCPRHRAPHDSFSPPGIHPRDHRSRKTSLRAWEFKGTTSPATSMWTWQIKERGDSVKMVQCKDYVN